MMTAHDKQQTTSPSSQFSDVTVEEVGDPYAWLFHSPPPERQVAVRPLRWKGPDSSGEYHSLDGLWGYIVRAGNGNGFWLTEVGEYFPTIVKAQEAAFADYERRIRAALTIATDGCG